jgi:hypothetical protein
LKPVRADRSILAIFEMTGSMNQCIAMWDPTQITFDLVDDVTADPVMTVTVFTPAGALKFIAEPERVGRTLVLRGRHVQDLAPDAVGVANLMVLAGGVMERMDVDRRVVAGEAGDGGGGRDRAQLR